jgi:hypothetical protein
LRRATEAPHTHILTTTLESVAGSSRTVAAEPYYQLFGGKQVRLLQNVDQPEASPLIPNNGQKPQLPVH